VPFEALEQVPAGRPFREGPVVRDAATGRVFLVTQETDWPAPRKHWINDLESFVRLGFSWEDIALDWPTPPEAYANAPALTFQPISREPATVATSAGYLTAVPFWQLQVEDERLYAALALVATYNSDWRAQVGSRLAAQGTWIAWGALPAQIGGYFDERLNQITINRSLGEEAPGVLAATLAHETLHAVYPHGRSSSACVQEEAAAFAMEVHTWMNLPAQYRRSTSNEAGFLRALTFVWQRQGMAGLAAMVGSNPAYQRECGLTPAP
jgi:hypothetical protein